MNIVLNSHNEVVQVYPTLYFGYLQRDHKIRVLANELICFQKELTGDENKYGEQLEKRFGIKRKKAR